MAKSNSTTTDNTYANIGNYLIIVVVVLVSFAALWIGGAFEDTRPKDVVGRNICGYYNWSYGGLVGRDKIRCETNITILGDHYNATLPKFEIYIKVDFDYYKNNIKKLSEGGK